MHAQPITLSMPPCSASRDATSGRPRWHELPGFTAALWVVLALGTMLSEPSQAAEPPSMPQRNAPHMPPTTGPQGSATLKGPDWQLLELDGRPVPAPAAPGREVRLQLSSEGSRVSGFTGCNRLIGGFELAGPALRFKTLASSRMACVGPAAELEAQMLQMLGSVTGWRIEGQQLQLLAGELVRARLTAARP